MMFGKWWTICRPTVCKKGANVDQKSDIHLYLENGGQNVDLQYVVYIIHTLLVGSLFGGYIVVCKNK